MVKRKRNSSIELLRIFSMFAIVIHHFAIHGTFNPTVRSSQFLNSYVVYNYLVFLGRLGVVIFVMIGAYFLCNREFNFKRPINLILTTAFYSFGIYLLLKYCFSLAAVETMLKSVTTKAFWSPFPLPSGYWFVGAYVLMLFLMPILNAGIKELSKVQLTVMIIVLGIFWSLIPTLMQIFPGKPDLAVDDFGYSHGIIFVLFYLVAAYIQKYSGKLLNSKKATFLLSIICLLVAFLISLLSRTGFVMVDMLAGVYALYNPLTIITAVFVFSFFKNCNFYNPFINYIAGSMFGIYLISDNTFVRTLIWQVFISSKNVAILWLNYLTEAVGYSFAIFVISMLLDIIVRRTFIEKLIGKLTVYIDKNIMKLYKH